jgi:hypothetical protein
MPTAQSRRPAAQPSRDHNNNPPPTTSSPFFLYTHPLGKTRRDEKERKKEKKYKREMNKNEVRRRR